MYDNNHILGQREGSVQRKAGELYIDLMIFSILIEINVTAIILIKKVSMVIHFCIPEHQQTLMPFFQLLLVNSNKTVSLHHKQDSHQVKRKKQLCNLEVEN